MAGNEFGKDWRIKIGDGATPEVFTAIGGETGHKWSRSSQEIDISDKDSGIYGSTSYGQQKISFDLSGNLKLPDDGFEALETASKTSPPHVNVEVVKGAIVKFKGLVAVGAISADFQTQGPVPYTATLVNVGAPAVDDLTATE